MFSNQVIICQISFKIFDDTREKSKYLNTSGYFPSLFHFPVENEINKKSSITEDTRRWKTVMSIAFQTEVGIQRCSIRKRCSQKFCKIHSKTRCQSFFFKKVAGLWLATLLKRYSGTHCWYRRFLASFAKFLRTSFFQNTSRPLVMLRVNRVSDHYARCIYAKFFL